MPSTSVSSRRSLESDRRSPESELGILILLGRIAVADLEVRPMLQRICDTMRQLLGWDLVAIVSLDPARSVVTCEALSTELEPTIRVGDECGIGAGVVGKVARSGSPIVVDDPGGHPAWASVLPGGRSQICVPIRHRDQVLALLVGESLKDGAFAGKLPFTELVASQIAGAIAAGRNLESCQRHSALIENALSINRLALNAVDLESMSESIVHFLKQRFGLTWVSLSIAIPDEALRGPKVVAVSEGDAMEALSWDERGGVVARAAITGKAQLVPDVREDPDYIERCPATRSELALPLHFQGQMLGVLNLESGELDAFGSELRHVLGVAASEFAAVVHMASLNRELDRVNRALAGANNELGDAMGQLRLHADRDGLTGVANRRFFDAALRREWDRAKRFGRGVGLVMIDLDYFKELNDTAGHLAGDDALRAVGRLLEGELTRGGDLVSRYGGEEFVVLLADVERWQAEAVADHLRSVIELAGIAHPTRDKLTASVGAAWLLATSAHQPGDLLASADACLYEAKKRGRNRTVVAD